ncbi:cation transporter [Cognatilysobacter terrigena]|uniref:cation transporter n=1 Tax=Cognatilysobacter terrigena TaxID=2488749 RepID=UPI00105E1E52|nr:cation transporter [Lysobacter terrigena]
MKLNVNGMTCGHCQRAIERAVAALGGTARVDLAAGTVEVTGVDDRASAVAAIEHEGYRVVDAAPAAPGGCCKPRAA